MIHFNWQSVNIKQVFYYSFVGAVLYLISSMADFIGLLYISASLERAVLFTFPIYVFLLSSDFIQNYDFKDCVNYSYCFRIRDYV